MNKRTRAFTAVFLALALIVLSACGINRLQTQGVTNFDTMNVENGTAAAPSLSFTSDPDTGMYRVGANNLGVAAAGGLVSDWNAAGMDMNALPITNIGNAGTDFDTSGGLTIAGAFTPTGVLAAPDGAVGAPSVTFASDTDNGLYRVGTNNVGMAAGGVLVSDWTATSLDMNALPVLNVGNAGTDFDTSGGLSTAGNITPTGVLAASAGAVGAPSVSFAGDPDGGLYSVGANNVGIAAGGVLVSDWNATSLDMNALPVLNIGNAGTDFDTSGGLTTAGNITPTGLLAASAGAVGGPSISFAGDPDGGLYSVGANNVGLAAGGVLVSDWTATSLDMNALPVLNIGNAGTDFDASGGLSTAGNITPTGVLAAADGAVGGPSISLATDPDTGLYAVGANNLGVAAGGVLVSDWTATSLDMNALPILNIGNAGTDFDTSGGLSTAGNITPTGVLAASAGAVGAPSISFAGDPDSGLYNIGANNIGLVVNGAALWDYSGVETSFVGPLTAPEGTAAAPILRFTGDTDTGFYHVGANNVGVSAGGANVLDVSTLGMTVTGKIIGSAEGSVVYNTMHDVTIAEINAGHTIVTVPATRLFRLTDVMAVAYGGSCATVTTVDLKVGSTTLFTYAQANLTQSNILSIGSTGVTALADGASFSAGAAGDDVTVIKNGSDVATCTGVRFILSYALE